MKRVSSEVSRVRTANAGVFTVAVAAAAAGLRSDVSVDDLAALPVK